MVKSALRPRSANPSNTRQTKIPAFVFEVIILAYIIPVIDIIFMQCGQGLFIQCNAYAGLFRDAQNVIDRAERPFFNDIGNLPAQK